MRSSSATAQHANTIMDAARDAARDGKNTILVRHVRRALHAGYYLRSWSASGNVFLRVTSNKIRGDVTLSWMDPGGKVAGYLDEAIALCRRFAETRECGSLRSPEPQGDLLGRDGRDGGHVRCD